MGINKGVAVTDTGSSMSVKVAGLHMCLKNLNESIGALGNANILNKAVIAERVLNDARDFMMQSALITLEMSGELNLINSQLARINGVMGFPHG